MSGRSCLCQHLYSSMGILCQVQSLLAHFLRNIHCEICGLFRCICVFVYKEGSTCTACIISCILLVRNYRNVITSTSLTALSSALSIVPANQLPSSCIATFPLRKSAVASASPSSRGSCQGFLCRIIQQHLLLLS